MASEELHLHSLQSSDQAQLLDDIDKLRSDGIQYHDISLPQLVVCGDQSSGKSSVLEAISNVKFPVDTSTCTRFALELALRRSPDREAKASIRPGRSAFFDEDRQRRLKAFGPSQVNLAEVPRLIEEACQTMGLSGEDTICDHVLRLEIAGPDLPHLTLVDLPGLIADAANPNHVPLVDKMVKDYMKNERSIILAIISAKVDKPLQKVLRYAREEDPEGKRTVGIITKPDALRNYRGTTMERDYMAMARNQDPVSKLQLGWHVVRNPDFHEKNDPNYNREAEEGELLSQEPWNQLDEGRLGIESLRKALTKHLFGKICSQLPRLQAEILREKVKSDEELKSMGELRVSSKDQRKYLNGISRRFEYLVGAGLEGQWNSDSFFDKEMSRLRAKIRNLNDEFERAMKTRGHTHEIIGGSFSQRPLLFEPGPRPKAIGRTAMLSKINLLLKSGRGHELPGLFDPLLVGNIFKEDSQNWPELARQHIDKVWKVTNQFLKNLILEIAPAKSDTADTILRSFVAEEMERRKQALSRKSAELLTPYTHNLPFCTPSRLAASMKEIETDASRNNIANDNVPNLRDQNGVEVDTSACEQLLRHAKAYYNIALETFVDNMATLAVENCLLVGLGGIFSSDKVADLDDAQLQELAGESEQVLSDRKYLEEKIQVLERALKTCERHMVRQPVTRDDAVTGLAQELGATSVFSDASNPTSGTPRPRSILSFSVEEATNSRVVNPGTGLFGSSSNFAGQLPLPTTGFFTNPQDSRRSQSKTPRATGSPNRSSSSLPTSDFGASGSSDITFGQIPTPTRDTASASPIISIPRTQSTPPGSCKYGLRKCHLLLTVQSLTINRFNERACMDVLQRDQCLLLFSNEGPGD